METDLNFLFLQNVILANKFILRSIQPATSLFLPSSLPPSLPSLMVYVKILQMYLWSGLIIGIPFILSFKNM